MAKIYEVKDSPEIVLSTIEPSAVRRYQVEDVTDEIVVETMALAFSPAVYLNLIRSAVRVAPITTGFWSVEVPYVPLARKPLELGEFRYSGKTTGGTRKITQSYSTAGTYSSTSGIPGPISPGVVDFGGLIGVTQDNVEGTDIITPIFEWTEEREFATLSVTNAYLGKLFDLTGKINNASFRGFFEGEVLFMGADFSIRTNERWKFIFSFKASQNIINQTFGNFVGVNKEGWQYAWTWDTPALNAGEGYVLRSPRYMMVENVYRKANFANLGIGVGPLFP